MSRLSVTRMKEEGFPTTLAQMFYSFVNDAEHRGKIGEEYDWEKDFYPRIPQIMKAMREELDKPS